MNDTISRQAAIYAASYECGELRGVFGRIEERLKALPSVQPDIVRCWECKWWELTPDNTMLPDWHRCRYYGAKMHTRVEDFCSRGERNG